MYFVLDASRALVARYGALHYDFPHYAFLPSDSRQTRNLAQSILRARTSKKRFRTGSLCIYVTFVSDTLRYWCNVHTLMGASNCPYTSTSLLSGFRPSVSVSMQFMRRWGMSISTLEERATIDLECLALLASDSDLAVVHQVLRRDTSRSGDSTCRVMSTSILSLEFWLRYLGWSLSCSWPSHPAATEHNQSIDHWHAPQGSFRRPGSGSGYGHLTRSRNPICSSISGRLLNEHL